MRKPLRPDTVGAVIFHPSRTTAMDTAKLVPLAIALGITLAVAKFAPNQMIKAAALGVAGVIVAKQIPYVQEALA